MSTVLGHSFAAIMLLALALQQTAGGLALIPWERRAS